MSREIPTMEAWGLFQFDGPVSVVEELFPAFVSLVAEVDVDERVVAGLDGLFDELHACVF